MTIYDIKQRTETDQPYFFDRKTLKFFGQTMRSFSLSKQPDGRIRITAPIRIDGRTQGNTIRYFNPVTNSLDRE